MNEDFGNRLTKLLKEKNIKSKEITEELSLNKNSIGNYKKGQIPNATILLALSQKLGISMNYLLTGEKDFDLTENEKELLNYFRMLDEREQIKLIGIAEEKAAMSDTKSSACADGSKREVS